MKVKADASGQPGNTIAQYEYDGLGRLIVRAADTDANGALDTFTHYFYAGEKVVETRDAASLTPSPESLAPTYQYVWSLRNVNAPILRDTYVDGEILAEDRVYYLTDLSNNVTALADASGNVIERYVYDPYGKVTIYDATWSNTRSASSCANCVLFGGMSLDPLTGLYGDRARWYHPGIGTFISRSPGAVRRPEHVLLHGRQSGFAYRSERAAGNEGEPSRRDGRGRWGRAGGARAARLAG